MNIVQSASLLYFLSFGQFSVNCDGNISSKNIISAEEIRLKNQEHFKVENRKLDCGADNHDTGCTTISERRHRSVNSSQLTWNIDRLDQRHLPLDKEYCPAATGAGVDVYIIGSGINYDHEVFNGRASFGGYDYFGDDGKDCGGLGTHQAGVAVGYPTGVAYEANVYSIRVFCFDRSLLSIIEEGIYHVIQRANKTGRRSVISLAYHSSYPGSDKAVRDAISNNIVVVTSAGDTNQEFCDYGPTSSPDVINVGATQQAVDHRYPGQHMLFELTSYGRCVHIFAPGKNILSASHINNTELTSRSTTHLASAAVVGVVATLLQRFPDYTPYQIREQLIRESTKDVINFHTRNGLNLPSKIAETTQNRFAYIRKCINRDNGPPGLQQVKGKKGKQGRLHNMIPRSKEQKRKRRMVRRSDRYY